MKQKYLLVLGFLSVIAVAVIFLLLRVAAHPTVTSRDMRDNVEQMFSYMKSTGIETDQKFLWGYFFTDSDRTRLEIAAPALEKQGYKIVEVRQISSFPPEYQLHVEKIEKHTSDSLNARNRKLSLFAEENKINCYDGMDVGPPDGKSSFEGFMKQKEPSSK